jgi:hypothetical protein
MNLNEEEKVELATYRKIKELQKYAEGFFKQLKSEMFCEINPNILPIYFELMPKNSIDEILKTNKRTAGDVLVNKKNKKQVNVIIYDVGWVDIEKLKQSVRHEICHYALYISNFNYDDNNYKDDTAAFWALASYYDADPYEELVGLQKDLFNKYQFIVDNYTKYREICHIPILKY